MVRHKLKIPVIYNCGGYELVSVIHDLNGYVDIYLPDMKYMETDLAEKYSHAADYPDIAKAAVAEIVRQTGPCEFGADGYIRRGTIVRHLILPGHTRNSREVLNYLHETYGDNIYISIMNQYTPMPGINARYPELGRKLTPQQYDELVDYAIDLGVENGIKKDGETAEESFIPSFDTFGV